MVKRAIELEGTATGEHGVGLVKRDYLEHELGLSTVDAMRKVCSLFLLAFREIFYDDNWNLLVEDHMLTKLWNSSNSPSTLSAC